MGMSGMDIYSETIMDLYDHYDNHDLKLSADSDLLLDLVVVNRATAYGYLTDDAREKADHLNTILQNEILSRMNRWRVIAERAAREYYNTLTSYQ